MLFCIINEYNMKRLIVNVIAITLLGFGSGLAQEQSKEPTKPEETEIWKPRVPVVMIGANNSVPSDAIVLFDGSNLDEWVSTSDLSAAKWIINEDGSMTVNNRTGNIETKKTLEVYNCILNGNHLQK